MIIVKLMGGLGNQLFQYAFGRRTALVNNTELKLDISLYGQNIPGTTPRHYSLADFATIQNIASSQETATFTESFLDKIKTISKKKYIRQEDFEFKPDFLTIGPSAYLEGYWQSEKYFKDIETTVRQEIRLRSPLSDRARDLAEKIKNTRSVSIHFRRGDYASDRKTNVLHGICSPDYYQKAIKYIAQRVQEPEFFVFSDDIPWVKENFNCNYPVTFVEGTAREQEDLMLMSACQHNIVANSSFSWWGAWLNTHTDKTVIAPEQWFKDPNIKVDDLIPKSWTLLAK